MTATLLPNGKQQFEDINGDPLVAGTVEFYVQETLVPKDTWQDSAQAVLNTNPVVLDSRGQALIYGSGVYRQIVKDVDGNTIWDQLTASNYSGTFGSQQVLASATTTDLGTEPSNNILITGTTTIVSFGTNGLLTNPFYVLRFDSSLTITNNNTSLILPNGVDITTRANDCALIEVIDEELPTWRIIGYWPANGTSLSITGPETSISSNTTTDLGSVASHLQKITNATTITGLGSSASTGNPLYFVKFASALTLIYNATSLILPGLADITTATNDFAVMEYLGAGNWICLNYSPAIGQSGLLLAVNAYATAGASTWTRPAGCKSIIAHVVGGGASGAGAGVSTDNHIMCGGGGGSGAYTAGRITTPAASYTVTVGAKGAAPSAGANNGNDGTASSLGTALVANGGSKGLASADVGTTGMCTGGGGNGGTVGTAGNLISATGSVAGYGFGLILAGPIAIVTGGVGGIGVFSGGAPGATTTAARGTAVGGNAGTGPGSGGSGAASWSAGSAANVAGGAGHDGYVIIYSYS